jgi:hypothetical protein
MINCSQDHSRSSSADRGLEEGEQGLQRLLFDVVLKLAELTERMAVAHQLTADDLADILFLD